MLLLYDLYLYYVVSRRRQRQEDHASVPSSRQQEPHERLLSTSSESQLSSCSSSLAHAQTTSCGSLTHAQQQLTYSHPEIKNSCGSLAHLPQRTEAFSSSSISSRGQQVEEEDPVPGGLYRLEPVPTGLYRLDDGKISSLVCRKEYTCTMVWFIEQG